MSSGKFRFSIDRGGTFTDIYAEVPNEPGYRVYKLLSVDSTYADAPREGIRRILEECTGKKLEPNCVPTDLIDSIRMGTTVATNALLERKGARVLLLITKGFRDLLQIGNQSRAKIFDLEMKRPDLLYERVIEVDERIRVIGKWETNFAQTAQGELHQGTSGEWIEVLQPPNVDTLRPALEAALREGITSVAIVFMHSFTFPAHEEQVAKLCHDVGFKQVSLSSGTLSMKKIVPRGLTCAADAYLTPLIRQYVESFSRGFDDNFKNVPVYFMMSDGGLCPVQEFQGFKAVLSGPAGGVVGYAMTTFNKDTKKPVIGFDMGGTSTDVSRFAGHYEHVYDTEVAGVTIQAPKLDITTVAAGGGSRLFFRSGLFVVGPESSGAEPGPVCYRKGGYLSVTDANLFLGRIVPEHFPRIFGPKRDQSLDAEATAAAFAALTKEINQYYATEGRAPMSEEEVAAGFIKVANESMCRPIRNITEAKGFATSDHVLACFGGAGGQHACAIARTLNMRTIFVHRFAGVLSAYGLGLSNLIYEAQQPCALPYSSDAVEALAGKINGMKAQLEGQLRAKGFTKDRMQMEVYLNLRYEGTDTSIMVLQPEANGPYKGDYGAAFEAEYRREFGFILNDRDKLIDDVRVRGIGLGSAPRTISAPAPPSPEAKPVSHSNCYFEGLGRISVPVYLLPHLTGLYVSGPAIIIDNTSTMVIEPNCKASISQEGNVVIEVTASNRPAVGTQLDVVLLSVMSNRFMSIAEQMGRTLQRTAISTNIKERLDFSCALFGPNGGLVANAPHLPVHLGSMQEAVKWQIHHLGSWKDGDVLMSNHPAAGGSHLPDITVITPVFVGGKAVFYVASRGHHADIGGISPGSMPPFSHTLSEEGACIKSFKLVEKGEFKEAGVTQLLVAPGNIPGGSGTRNLHDNLSDLRAQVAANQKGIGLVNELIAQYSLETVQAYMGYVQQNAEAAVRDMLKQIYKERGLKASEVLHATDYMDDGTPIVLSISINGENGTAVFDFTGTGPEVYGNCNAPRAVAVSAILYCLRCLIKQEIPLNEGCLTPITIIIPENSILSPSEDAAVVGGNVLTSQRVTDVVLCAFAACACSQGCMNNFTFGDSTLGYYETIAGGAGAGPTWPGQHGIHTHMTNCFPADHEVLTELGFMNLETVRSHFKKHATLSIACHVDDRLEFHPITVDKVTVHEGQHDHVLFESTHGEDASSRKLATANISLMPTGNHRMWLAMGRTVGKNRHWPQLGANKSRVAPPFAFYSADEVVAAGAADASTDVQLVTHFAHGFSLEEPIGTLPFCEPLGLRTSDHVDAFLELYGYWLGDGWLDGQDGYVMFGPSKPQDWKYLDDLFDRLPLAQQAASGYGYGERGYTRSVLEEDAYEGVELEKFRLRRNGPSPQRYYRILEKSWRTYFAEQYGHKYEGDVAEAAAEASKHEAAEGGGSVATNAAAALCERPAIGASGSHEPGCAHQHAASSDGGSGEISLTPPASEGIKSAKWFWHWVWQRGLGIRRLRCILSGLRFANGNEHTGSKEGGCIGTSSVRFRDEAMRLALLAGYSAVFWRHTEKGTTRNGNIWGVPIRATVDHWRVSYTLTQRGIHPRLAVMEECSRVTMVGLVWCVTVPTAGQRIMVRRVLETSGGVVIRASRPTIVGNTRITDAEILELRYPVLLREFSLRHGSGGRGRWPGGDGVVREVEFLRSPFTAGILSERRAFEPKGMAGGGNGARGRTLLIRAGGHVISLGAKNTVQLRKGDKIRIETPGGGAWGAETR